jgi:hypothetical protein
LKNATALAFTFCVIGICSSRADDWFAMNWSGTMYTLDSSGKLIAKSYSAKNVVATIAANNGLNPGDLVLVYRPAAFDTAVVFKSASAMARAGVGSDAQVVADFIQMPDVTKVGSSYDAELDGNNGQTARQAYLFDEQGSPIGTASGLEKQKSDGNGGVAGESYHGTFHFTIPADGTHSIAAPGIYMGTFSTGGRVKDLRGQ